MTWKVVQQIFFLMICTLLSSCAIKEPTHFNIWPKNTKVSDVIEKKGRQHVKKGQAYGIVIGFKDKKKNETKLYAIGQNHKNQPINSDDVFGLGSLTKIYTTTLVASLVQQQKIALDESIYPYLPSEIQQANPSLNHVTFHKLVTHRAGFKQYSPGKFRFYSNYFLSDLGFGYHPYRYLKTPYALNYLKNFKATNQPRESKYADFNLAVLGYVLTQKLNMPLTKIYQTYLFKPLNLKHSYLSINDVPKNSLVQGHAGMNGVFKLRSSPFPDPYIPEFMNPSIGMYASVEDVLKVVSVWQHDSKTTLDDAVSIFNHEDKDAIFNPICVLKKNKPTHCMGYKRNGVGTGYATHLYFSENPKVSLVVLKNALTFPDTIGHEAFLNALAQHRPFS